MQQLFNVYRYVYAQKVVENGPYNNKKAHKTGLFCHLVRLMGFEPIYYNGIPCYLLPRVQFRVHIFVKFGTDTPRLYRLLRTLKGPSGVGSS